MKFFFNPTGNLYKDKKSCYSAKNYLLETSAKNDILRQKNIIPLEFLKPDCGWLESNEPENHLEKVSISIRKSFKTIKNILCFSYKDLSLAMRIKEKNTNIDILFSNKSGILGDFPEDMKEEEICSSLKNLKVRYDLIIFRHYLEHFENIQEILYDLNRNLEMEGICFLEVPDCGEFIKKKNPLFLWEQHRWYFTYPKILNWLESNFSYSVNSFVENYIMEPSLCFFLKKTNSLKSKENSLIVNSKKSQEDMTSFDFEDYIKGWSNCIDSCISKVAMIGIGHNSDRFLQLTNARDKVDFLIDDSKDKQGKFIAKCSIQITNNKELIDTNSLILLGVHPRNFQKFKNILNKKYKFKNICSIFNNYPNL